MVASIILKKSEINNKSLAMAHNECINYPVGNSIKVLYNKDKDEFIYKIQ